jgi:glycosyltransferase involved in cell wall biosynthesis
MKIALIAPTEETVPPTKYGGTEWIVYYIAEGMAQKGHEVDLYAPGNSEKGHAYNLVATTDHSLRTLPDVIKNSRLLESTKLLSLEKTIHQISLKNYDVVHNHASWRGLLFARNLNHKVVTTHHGPLNLAYQNIIFTEFKDYPYVSISKNQRKDFPDLNFVANIYNGTDTSRFPFVENVSPEAPMAFLARMSEEKGAIEATQVAKMTKHKLLIATKVDPSNQSYYEKLQTLLPSEYVQSEGELGFDEKVALLQQSRCLLVPIQWEEPFGLMFTEAMACGTPVITFSRGSAPEIVEDGKTGFLVNQSEEYIRGDFIIKKTGIEGLCEAVERMYALPENEYNEMRQNSHKHVEDNFTVEKMVDNYEQLYKKLADQN